MDGLTGRERSRNLTRKEDGWIAVSQPKNGHWGGGIF